MTWFKVDDSFHSHPKALAAGPAALGLWVIAGSWSCANLTDGFVPDYVLPRLTDGARELAETLVAVGLWRRAKGGYRYHDWAVYQLSREGVLEERRKWTEKKARQREAKRAKHNQRSSGGAPSPGDTPGDSTGDSSGESRSSRSRPHSSPYGEEESRTASRRRDPNEPRPDVDRLCEHLASRIEENGSRRPTINTDWRDAARLLMDKDGKTEEQVRAAIDWCQNDEFWRANILSMPKLRKQYDQLRLHATRAAAATGTARPAGQSRNSQIIDAAMERALEAERRMVANGQTDNAPRLEITQ